MEPPCLDISIDVVDIPVEGMFASADWKVINRDGENYYRACGEVVFERNDGSTTSCIKPVGHIRWTHEDAHGYETDPHFGVQEMSFHIREAAFKILRRTGIEDTEVFNVLNALQYAGFTLSREP